MCDMHLREDVLLYIENAIRGPDLFSILRLYFKVMPTHVIGTDFQAHHKHAVRQRNELLQVL